VIFLKFGDFVLNLVSLFSLGLFGFMILYFRIEGL
jgi:hypothetical protein